MAIKENYEAKAGLEMTLIEEGREKWGFEDRSRMPKTCYYHTLLALGYVNT